MMKRREKLEKYKKTAKEDKEQWATEKKPEYGDVKKMSRAQRQRL